MLRDRVKCAVANPGGPIGVGSVVTLGAAPVGFRTFLGAFGAGQPAYFVLSDGAGKALGGIWTVNGDGTATITAILINDATGGTESETFASACTAWNALPSRDALLTRLSPIGGFRNLLINANPIINQRGYVSGTATVAANQYTLDRWRIVTSGQAVSWTDSAGVRTVTAPAGGMEQVIEGASILGGVHTLNWAGTATATVNGANVTKGAQVTLTGNANATLRFTGGTWSRAQLEPGPLATMFEARPRGAELALCERYYEVKTAVLGFAAFTAFVFHVYPISMVPKRANPTISLVTSGASNVQFLSVPFGTTSDFHFLMQNTAVGNCSVNAVWRADAEI